MKFSLPFLALSAVFAVSSTAVAAPLDIATVAKAVHKAAVRNLPETVVAVEVHDVYLRGNVDVPEGAAVSVRIRADGDEDWIGRFAATALVSINGQRAKAIPLTADVAAYIEMPVLRVPISRGTVLRAADLSYVPREVGTLPVGVVRDAEAVIGRTTKRDLGLNQVIRNGDFVKAVDARRNRAVTLFLKRGALTIAAPALLKQDAMVGDLVQVLCAGTRTLLYGTLVTPDLVILPEVVTLGAGLLPAHNTVASIPEAVAARPEVP